MADFPPAALEEAHNIAALQKLFAYLCDENVEETKNEIMNTIFVSTIERMYQLVHEMFSMIEIRFRRLPAFAKLVSALQKCANESNALSHLKPIIFKSSFRPYGKLYLHKKATTLTFVRHCLLCGAITIEDISNQIKKTLNDCIFETPDNSLYYLFFGYELKSYDEPLFNKLYEMIDKKDVTLQGVTSNLDVFCANNWEKMRQLTEYGCYTDGPIYPILSDDLESLKKFTDYTKVYQNLFFQPRFIFERQANLLQIAAFYRATNCFEYLLSKDLPLKDVEKYAAAGGERKIVEICKTKGFKFEETIKTVSRFQRLRLFEEIFNGIKFESRESEFEALNADFAGSLDSVFGKCARVNNMNSLLYTISKGATPTRWNVGGIIYNLANDGHLGPLMLLGSLPGTDVSGIFQNSTALFQAAENGHLGCIKYLLKLQGADLTFRKGSRTLLHAAALNGHQDVVEYLLELPQTDANALDANKRTALFSAITGGHLAVVRKMLASQRVDKNLKDSDGCTPLHFASRNAGGAVVATLAAADGIELNAKDRLGNTPFHYAASRDTRDAAVSLAGVDGVDFGAANKLGNTPLHMAAEAFTSAIDVVLGIPSVDANARNKKGQTPLHLAAGRNRQAAVAALLRCGRADPNLPDGLGRTPLLAAAAAGHAEAVRLLVEDPRVDVNTGNPLYAAAEGEWEDVVKALVACPRVDLEAEGPSGKKPGDVGNAECRKAIKAALVRK